MSTANSARKRKSASLKVVSNNEASTAAETLGSAEALVSWMLGIVEEWKEKDGKVFSIAAAAREWNKLGDDIISGSLFAIIEDQTESNFHSQELNAGIYRLAQLLSVQVKKEVAHG